MDVSSQTVPERAARAVAARALAERDQQARLAVRLQFPRRGVLLFVAFGLAWALIALLSGIVGGGLPARDGGGGGSILAERMALSVPLLGVTLLLVGVQTAVATALAVGVHALEARTGVPGSILKGLGRLWVFSQAATPVFALGLLLILFFALQLRLLPAAWGGAAQRAGLLERLPFLILPSLCLALLPATITAQVIAHEITLPREQGGRRVWLGGLLKGLAALAGQMGGLLSALVLVEFVFGIPGVGRLFMDAFLRLDVGIAAAALTALAGLTLLGRLGAELFRWLARLLAAPPAPATARTPTPWRQTARRIWLVGALVLLLPSLCQTLGGLTVSAEALAQTNPAQSNQGPSGDHLLGTDQLGRDVLARVLRGGLSTVGKAVIAAVLLTVFGGLGGVFTAWLANRGTLLFESLADLLGLPGHVLLMLPAVPAAAILSIALFRGGSWLVSAIVAALVLLPRAASYAHALWTASPDPLADRKGMLAGFGSLGLAMLFAAVWLVSALDFLGFGARPPAPTLGGMLAEGVATLGRQPVGVAAPALALWLPAFVFYTAASALAGSFPTKEPLARLNE